MGKSKKSKYAAELARLKALNAVKDVLKKSDIENAALTNTSKDSETVSDNAINNMLNELNLDKNATKDLEIVESLSQARASQQAASRARRLQAKPKPAKKARAPRRAKPKARKSRKRR